MKKLIGILIALVIIGLLGWGIYTRIGTADKGDMHRGRGGAVAVETAPVSIAEVRDVAVFTGTLMPETHYYIAPKISGRLKKLHMNIGDRVKPNQLVAELDNQEYAQEVLQADAALAVAEANVKEANSSLTVAVDDFDRVRKLLKKNVASESEYDSALAQKKVNEARLEMALAQVEQKKAAIEAARIQLSYTKIHATWESKNKDEYRRVGERLVDEGALLNSGEPIVSIIDIRSLKAVINVIERDYPKIEKRQEAVVTADALPDRKFFGEVTRIAPLLKETSRQARVEINLDNKKEILIPGMFVRVEIEFTRHENATVVPNIALAKRDGRQGVFVLDRKEMKARFVPLKLGIRDGEMVEIVDPKIEGTVVTLGHHLLEDGSEVVLPADKPGEHKKIGNSGRGPGSKKTRE